MPKIYESADKSHLLNNTLCAYSSDLKFYASVESEFIHVTDCETKKILNRISIKNININFLSFDSLSNYIILGDYTGNVSLYKNNHSLIFSKLYSPTCSKNNFNISFAFHKNLFTCSTYEGNILLINLSTFTKKHISISTKSAIGAISFIDEHRLIVGLDNGAIEIIDIDNESLIKSLQAPLFGIKYMLKIPDSNYAALSGNSETISILDIKNYKIIHSKYVELEDKINKLDISLYNLIATLKNGKIFTIELPNIKNLKSLVIHNSIQEAFSLIEKEPIFQNSSEHIMLKERFLQSYNSAINALENQNSDLAHQLLNPYKSVKSKQFKIKELFKAFEHFTRFQELILEKKYALAYGISSKFEAFKKTQDYIKMENDFLHTFLSAQKYIIKDDIISAKSILNDYVTVISKKPLINLLLTQTLEYKKILEAIRVKNFIYVDNLIKKNKNYAEIPNYISMVKKIEKTLDRFEAEIENENIDISDKYLINLLDSPRFFQKAQIILEKYSYMNKLQNAYVKNDFKNCYDILDEYGYLKSTKLGVMLENYWQKLIFTCEGYALRGEIKEINKLVADYTNSTRKEKINTIIEFGFRTKIDMLLQDKAFADTELLIYKYIDTFKSSTHKAEIIVKYEDISKCKLAITVTSC